MESTPTPIIEITELALVPSGSPGHDDSNRLAVANGDVIAIANDSPTVGRHLLRIMATLDRPERGAYRFQGKPVDPKDSRQCLTVKRQIGYVAADAAMISNRTIRENLLLSKFYTENDLTIDIDNTVVSLCRGAGLLPMLNQRPSVLSDAELLKAIAIREMSKVPAVMLIDRPENFMVISDKDGIYNHLKDMVRSGTAVVFVSLDATMNGLANRELTVVGGKLRIASV